MTDPLIIDCEVFPNLFSLGVLDPASGRVTHFERTGEGYFPIEDVMGLLEGRTSVGFNSSKFDLPLISYAIAGASCEELKAMSNAIIRNNIPPWKLAKRYRFTPFEPDHIDIIEVAPGQASLKVYAGRLHSPRLQDLPFEHDRVLTVVEMDVVRRYCANDLAETLRLYRSLTPQIELRTRMSADYGEDLRSKSDAQIAEAVIRHRLEEQGVRVTKPEVPEGHPFRYKPPRWVTFQTQPMQDLLARIEETVFSVKSSGKVDLPKELTAEPVAIGDGRYRMGIGGLHSSEKRTAHVADEETVLVDRDVTSYYPNIILNCGLYPKHLGPKFLEVYRDLVERRQQAKAAGDNVTADSLKITVNGSFGKLGSRYSFLYSPPLLIQTTLTGQLALLMLIESLECEGIRVVSANTDGLVIKCPRDRVEDMNWCVEVWETSTGFVTEATEYEALYSRDVNNYIALKAGGGFKLKGAYAPASLMKNPVANIAVIAALEFLAHGTPIAETVAGCDDIRQFVCLRKVTGGAVWNGEDLGRVVLWYYSTLTVDPVTYKVNGYKVPSTDGAWPLLEMPDEIPPDLDRDWYIRAAQSITEEVGYA